MAKVTPNIPNIINSSPQAAAVLSKLNTGPSANRRPYTDYNYTDIAISTANKIRNNQTIVDLLPDLEIAIQIMVASILDPNGMVSNHLVYKTPTINMLNNIKTSIMDTISKYIEENYHLEDKLPIILRETLFTKGAYVEAIIPEASLDRLINFVGGYNGLIEDNNINNEAIDSFIGSLHYDNVFNNKSDKWTINTEEFKVKYQGSINSRDIDKAYTNTKFKLTDKVITLTEEDLNLEIIDNPYVLLKNKIKTDTLINLKTNKLTSNLEDNLGHDTVNYLDILFRNNTASLTSELEFTLKEDETIRESLSKPFIIKLPVESVIPIHASSDPTTHVGYFVLLDENGAPINLVDELEAYDEMAACGDNIGPNRDMNTHVINKAKRGLLGGLGNVPRVDNIEILYGDIVDHMIKQKLRYSKFEDIVDIRDNADIYRVMLFRALSSKQTKLLYLPIDLVQYYAFKYRRNGTGESLLEKATILASMAGMLLYSNVKSSIQNAVPITDITLTLDDDDPEPLSTANRYFSELLRANNVAFPLGMVDPIYLNDWVIRSGYTVKVESKFLPQMNVTRDTRADTRGGEIDPNHDMYTKVINMIVKSLGMSPELIEQGFKEDFAATVVAKNKLLAKRVILLQNQFVPQVTNHVRKLIINDPILKDMIKEVIKINKADIKKGIKSYKSEDVDIVLGKIKDSDLADYIVNVFATAIEIELPSPDFRDEDEKAQAYSAFTDRLDKAIEDIYNEDMFNNNIFGEKASEFAGHIKNLIKTGALYKWMTDNNYLTELTDWFTEQDDKTIKEPYFDNNLTLSSATLKEYIKFLKLYAKSNHKFSKELESILAKLEEDGVDTDSMSSSDTNSDESDTESSGESSGDEYGDMEGEGDEFSEEESTEETEEGSEEDMDFGEEDTEEPTEEEPTE